ERRHEVGEKAGPGLRAILVTYQSRAAIEDIVGGIEVDLVHFGPCPGEVLRKTGEKRPHRTLEEQYLPPLQATTCARARSARAVRHPGDGTAGAASQPGARHRNIRARRVAQPSQLIDHQLRVAETQPGPAVVSRITQ